MATKVNIDTVVKQMNNISDKTKECDRLVRQIYTFYVDGMYSEWNTKAAADYIDSLCNAINDFSSQFNTKMQAGIFDFHQGVNRLLSEEKIPIIQSVTFYRITHIQRDWNPQETQFNLPEDFVKFTKDNFRPAIEGLNQALEDIKSYMNTAVRLGLNDSFCTRLRSALIELVNSARNVAEKFSTNAASAAANRDKTTLSLKNNT